MVVNIISLRDTTKVFSRPPTNTDQTQYHLECNNSSSSNNNHNNHISNKRIHNNRQYNNNSNNRIVLETDLNDIPVFVNDLPFRKLPRNRIIHLNILNTDIFRLKVTHKVILSSLLRSLQPQHPWQGNLSFLYHPVGKLLATRHHRF
ncbi:putative uncharacterized protein DDB_G0292330 isoform X2 [Temnothorax curvispinosus]|uniref:Uncharacterized protein n=1 Tax=Temnothorax curvispinosus TaxID=300111 RepID=A0A6J1QNS8_9HYME|nr:putative uncharacterized protein DDB_G0292330 isoform X2 [Temnothorax curvispinosus]